MPMPIVEPRNILNLAFYRFVELSELQAWRVRFRELCGRLGIRGTIMLSLEGINGYVAGSEAGCRELIDFMNGFSEFKGIEIKETWSDRIPFGHLFVKLKKEIIPLGRPEIVPSRFTGKRLSPSELKKWLDEGRPLTLVDTRNGYEMAHGTFEGAVDLDLTFFRDFPEKLEAARSRIPADRPLVMFCTGGIRCEKATAYALQSGFAAEEIYQLDGGILKYFEDCGDSHYQGSCYVFDERVAVMPRAGRSAEAGRPSDKASAKKALANRASE